MSATDVATIVTAVFTAVAAVASWRSASSSLVASRDAREAVAIGVAPRLALFPQLRTTVDGGVNRPTGVQIRVNNTSGWPATDVLLEVRYRDRPLVTARRERLSSPDDWIVPLPDIGGRGKDGYDDLRERIEGVTVGYSDERSIARYQAPLDIVGGAVPVSSIYRTRIK